MPDYRPHTVMTKYWLIKAKSIYIEVFKTFHQIYFQNSNLRKKFLQVLCIAVTLPVDAHF